VQDEPSGRCCFGLDATLREPAANVEKPLS
jgi:hypothetical protein